MYCKALIFFLINLRFVVELFFIVIIKLKQAYVKHPTLQVDMRKNAKVLAPTLHSKRLGFSSFCATMYGHVTEY